MSDDLPPVDDLFGDEDLGLDPATAPKSPSRFAGAFNKPIAWYVGGGLVLFILYMWAASANGDDFYLNVDDDGGVSVERGYSWLPFGHGEYDAPNRGYRPFRLPVGMSPENVGPMDRATLDEQLHHLYLKIAEHELDDLEAGDPDIAEDMLLRANKLESTSVADDRKLLKLLGDVAFRRGLTEVRGVQMRFDEALKQFQLSAMRGGEKYKGAQRWVEAISRLRAEFRQLSKESGLDPDQVLDNAGIPEE